MNNLKELRTEIDNIDNQLLELLKKRISVVKQIGGIKKNLHKPIRDYEREKQKLAMIEQKAYALHIPKALAVNIWKLFFEVSEEIEK